MKKSYEELQQEVLKYKSFIGNSLEGIYAYECRPPVPTNLSSIEQAEWMFDSGVFVECNRAFSIMYGKKSPKEILGKPVSKIVKKEYGILKVFQTFVEAGYYLGDEESVETDDSGKTHHFLNNTFGVIENDHIVRVWGTQRDVTALRKLQENMQHMQKLESIGILAGGIAHDFNNILTGLLANISLLRMEENLPQNELDIRLLEAENACMRAKDLTNQLLTFAKGGQPIKTTFDLIPLVTETCTFALRGSAVSVLFDLENNLACVEADEGQITQVISNLLINAKQAMTNGEIKIKAKNVYLSSADQLNLAEGAYVKISVIDQGSGISKAVLNQVFDPFFTTKKTGHGLGLSTVFSIIKNHHGVVKIKSEIGQGTTVSIYLPATQNIVGKAKNDFVADYKGSGYVLVMDDEESIRSVLSKLLEKLGFKVLEAKNGEEAISIYTKALTENLDVKYCLLDLTVPGKGGGLEIIKELIALNANVKALILSGYSTSPVMSDYQNFGFCGVIKKPFRVADLLAEFRRLDADR